MNDKDSKIKLESNEVKNEIPKVNLDEKKDLKEDAVKVKEIIENKFKVADKKGVMSKEEFKDESKLLLTEEQKIDFDYDTYKQVEEEKIAKPEPAKEENKAEDLFVFDNVSGGGGGGGGSKSIINERPTAPVDPIVNEIHNFIPKTEVEINEKSDRSAENSINPANPITKNAKGLENKSENERYKEMYLSFKEMYSRKPIEHTQEDKAKDNNKKN